LKYTHPILLILFCLVISVAKGQNFIINSTADNTANDINDGICDTGNMVSGIPECTMRAAFQEVNQSVVPATIEFDVQGCVKQVNSNQLSDLN
jgi:hypothetical protein